MFKKICGLIDTLFDLRLKEGQIAIQVIIKVGSTIKSDLSEIRASKRLDFS